MNQMLTKGSETRSKIITTTNKIQTFIKFCMCKLKLKLFERITDFDHDEQIKLTSESQAEEKGHVLKRIHITC